jgi:1-acyl-sn-glycerol-3-phosphate acyltransferase
MPERRRKPRHVGAVIRLGSLTLPPLRTALFRTTYRNQDLIPADGPVIVVANHVSYIDPIVMATFMWDCARVPRFLAKESLFRMPVLGRLMRGGGQIPVSRGSRDAAQSLDAAAGALDRGEVIVIYPEGTVTRDPDFWPSSGKTGAARLALLRPDVPVIAVGQWGAQDSVDVYNKHYRPIPRKRITIRVGGPVDLSRYAGADPTAATLRAITDELMTAITAQVAAIRGLEPPSNRTGRR